MISQIEKNAINLYQLKAKKDLIYVEQFFFSFLKKNFFQNIKNNRKYLKKNIKCICGSKKIVNRKKIGLFNYSKCKCGNIYISPMITNKGLDLIYSDKGPYSLYRKKFVKKKKSNQIRTSLVNKRKFEQLNLILNKKNSIILDYGCGDGAFLEACYKGGYTNLYGIDSNLKDAKKKFKIKFHQNIEEIKSVKFDCVTMWGVLEHLNDPINFLLKIRKKLKNNGKILFEVPNSESLLMNYIFKSKKNDVKRFLEPGRHLYFFSLNYLKKYIKRIGFQLEDFETNGLDIQSILGPSKSKNELNKILKIQKYLDNQNLSDHLRVVIKKKNNFN